MDDSYDSSDTCPSNFIMNSPYLLPPQPSIANTASASGGHFTSIFQPNLACQTSHHPWHPPIPSFIPQDQTQWRWKGRLSMFDCWTLEIAFNCNFRVFHNLGGLDVERNFRYDQMMVLLIKNKTRSETSKCDATCRKLTDHWDSLVKIAGLLKRSLEGHFWRII